MFSGQYFQCRDESEILRAVHMIEVHGFYSSLKKDILADLSFSSGIMKMDSVQLKNLIDYLNSHDGFHLDEMQELIYKLYDEFVAVYQRLIPALAIQYCKDGSFDFESHILLNGIHCIYIRPVFYVIKSNWYNQQVT